MSFTACLLNGLRVFEFYLIMTREDYPRNTNSDSNVGPVYVLDISKPDRSLAMMIHPGHGSLASEKVKKFAQKVIESSKLMQ